MRSEAGFGKEPRARSQGPQVLVLNMLTHLPGPFPSLHCTFPICRMKGLGRKDSGGLIQLGQFLSPLTPSMGLSQIPMSERMGFPGGASGKEPACQSRRQKRHVFDPWVGKIPWRRAWQLTPLFLPGKSHGEEAGGLQSIGSQRGTTEATWHMGTG